MARTPISSQHPRNNPFVWLIIVLVVVAVMSFQICILPSLTHGPSQMYMDTIPSWASAPEYYAIQKDINPHMQEDQKIVVENYQQSNNNHTGHAEILQEIQFLRRDILNLHQEIVQFEANIGVKDDVTNVMELGRSSGDILSIMDQVQKMDEPDAVSNYDDIPKAGMEMQGMNNEIHSGSPYDSTSQSDAKQKPLNILILYPDDWRHDTIGGVAPFVHTPFLNELASEGIRFTHNMVTTSICWISRATLFTGQYASRHKSYRLRTPEFYKKWHNESWPALLQKVGYFTGHIGKWQYWDTEEHKQHLLFNHTKIFEGYHEYWYQDKKIPASNKTYLEVRDFLRNRPKDHPFAVTAAFYPPKAVGESFTPGAQWSPQPQTVERFYSNVTFPHPYNETDSYNRLPWFFKAFERYGRGRWAQRFDGDERYQAAMRNYYSLVTEVDQASREIIEELDAQGVLNDTLIIFTTDNGLFHSEHGLAGKWYPYQESIRVPLIIRDPRMPLHRRNTLDGHITLNVDLQPTILGAAGIEPPPTTQGRDIADLYLDEPSSKEPWRTEFFYEFPLDENKQMPTSTALVRKDIKYINWTEFNYEQLFNLTEDPLELNDVRQNPEYADILRELIEHHNILREAAE